MAGAASVLRSTPVSTTHTTPAVAGAGMPTRKLEFVATAWGEGPSAPSAADADAPLNRAVRTRARRARVAVVALGRRIWRLSSSRAGGRRLYRPLDEIRVLKRRRRHPLRCGRR